VDRFVCRVLGACAIALAMFALWLAGASSALAATATWSVQWPPTPTGATSSALAGVTCPAGNACFGVGEYVNSLGVKATLAEVWNGTAWSISTTPNPARAATSALSGVSCLSATACTAVGYYVDPSSGVDATLVEQWNGTAWSIQYPENPTGGGVLSGVSCIAGTCTAVGHSGQNAPLAEEWTGTGSAWVIQPTVNPAAGGTLSSVSCTAAGACSAVGQSGSATLAEAEWKGTAWSIQSMPNPIPTGIMMASGHLSSVSCTGSTGCTAVGGWTGWQCQNGKPTCNCLQYPYCHHRLATLAERWDGATWAIQPTVSPGYTGSTLPGVSCLSTTDCTAVGYYIGVASGDALAEQWNGSTWSYQYPPTPSAGASLTSVSCTAATACTAVGQTNASGPGVALAERYSG
jgi:hypothetical protein